MYKINIRGKSFQNVPAKRNSLKTKIITAKKEAKKGKTDKETN